MPNASAPSVRSDGGRIAAALHRRDAVELLSEELRRLDPDDVYAKTLQTLVERDKLPEADKKVPDSVRKSDAVAAKSAASNTATKEPLPRPSLTKKAAKDIASKKKTAASQSRASKTTTKKTAASSSRSAKKTATRKKAAK